ncbi:hypothetical protein AMS68_006193 [Peltaster fructicola]|uniref:alpha-glucosidase n=1 Tax=Peltaster fructicola TaxID=286661 RepID=A0A6H0Y161_9PEZI|nr:hypothetical protein AMS68_006193 [Peltaster fructicola]
MVQQRESVPTGYHLIESEQHQIAVHLQAKNDDEQIDFSFEAIKPGIFRTTFSSATHPVPPYPSARKPSTNTNGFEQIRYGDRQIAIQHENVEARVTFEGVPLVTIGYRGKKPLYADLPYRSYAIDGPGIAHYTRYHRGSLHIGLGEKAAPMDLSNRHFTLSATDCFGYDVLNTDPMYKHIPLLIRATPDGVVGTFSTAHARGYYSIGSEMDGMWGFYKVYRQDHGGLEEYTMIGKTLQDVVRLYAELVGFPLLVPRWAFGYLAGGMKYSMLDEPRASDALMEFADKIERYDIPCSGFQMSSGYTVAETEPKTRNVFTWNKHRFPDPKGFVQAFLERGIRLIANIKPYVLATHPEYEKLVKADALFKDMATGGVGIARLWSAGGGESGEGGHIDFTSKTGYDWWFNGVKSLREIGIDCMWNDNNEYLVPNDSWQCAMDQLDMKAAQSSSKQSRCDIGLWGRALHTELMGKSSHDALLAVAPHERPFVLTRSATAGTMRYCASSWSGDNVTSWDGMRGANALSLTAGMCLMQCYGHDIGGFEGPQPSPELLLRWVQLGIHSPRFAINCFKTGNDNLVGDVIEPWMYPEILPEVRKAICRRYELIPYVYDLMLRSHATAVPPQRWVGWGYETDPEVWTNKVLKDGEQQYWLGDTLLIGGVYESGVSEAKVYLPKAGNEDPGFLNTHAPYQYLRAGKWHTIASPWKDSIPVLARIGGGVPVGKDKQTVAPGDRINQAKLTEDDWRGVEIFPTPEDLAEGIWYTSTWSEDDGISTAERSEQCIARFSLSYAATSRVVKVKFEKDTRRFEPPWVKHGLTVILPVSDTREVTTEGHRAVQERRTDELGRKRYHINI